MIYSPETKQNKVVRYLNAVSRNTVTIYIQMVLYTVITYSVQDGSPLSHWTLLPVSLFAPWVLLCCWSTAYLAPCLEGWALSHPPHSGWPYFHQCPGTFPLLHRLHLPQSKARIGQYKKTDCHHSQLNLMVPGKLFFRRRVKCLCLQASFSLSSKSLKWLSYWFGSGWLWYGWAGLTLERSQQEVFENVHCTTNF